MTAAPTGSHAVMAAPAASHAVAGAPSPSPAAPEFQCEEDEAKRLLVKFANASLPSNKPPASAGAALLQQLARLAEKSGLTVSRNANGTILFSTGQAETVVLFEDGLFGTIKRDRKSFPTIPIQWNAFERRFEGTQPERAPRDGEPEFRIPRRSALAVLTEVILARLSAGEVK